DGITRDTLMQLARDHGYTVVEAPITRDDLYVADEIFLTGTAAEVRPIREVDHRQIGAGVRGPVAEVLQASYFEAVTGQNGDRSDWLTPL
ncbi:aminotransferase class IV, partial [Myxococcota bacterium]|nr:aminotransferase class IV [Myxococcota bacterium]